MAAGSYQLSGAYGQFVSLVGNKAHELDITNTAETKLLDQALQTQQSESEEPDEEAANLFALSASVSSRWQIDANRESIV